MHRNIVIRNRYVDSDIPDILNIYRMLPRMNCRRCRYMSCIAFAAALRSDPAKLPLCPHLSKQDFANIRRGQNSGVV